MDTTATCAPTTFGLLRHGKTVWNEEKRVQGRGNSPLTEEGISQTEQWAKRCHVMAWDRIIASDLGRVQQTVTLLNEQLRLPVTFDHRLREQDWGTWEGMRVTDVRQQYPEVLAEQIAAGWDFTPPDGESRAQARARAFEALNDAHATHAGQNILIVCHLGIIKCLVYAVAGRSFLPHEPSLLEKDRLHRISCNDNGYAITELNIHPSEETGNSR
ncbi:histidine phosphatase family protein [Desulfopila sp. IMCC35008]|uniref:histidine phosphatase family protein n=1 Tax=Desulfopila sp. IMCC35008 TaxID=2653858 RepID=UPI0013D53EC4|nr:histidine phosphatase family protein [Desulfopila sp. IMCC35008]